MDIAQRHNLVVIEDAAQGFLAAYRSRPLGSIGHLAALSFHETKNVISGEGGALLINDDRFRARAEIIWEKGTNRSHFLRGEVEKYTWVDIGSSFLPGELTAAFLWAQLESAHEMTNARLRLWEGYASGCAALQHVGVRCPIVPDYASHNAHLFYLLLPPTMPRAELLADLNTRGVNAIFHYVPLHESAAGRRYARVASHMDVSTSVSSRLIRLPIWIGLNPSEMEFVIASVAESLTHYV